MLLSPLPSVVPLNIILPAFFARPYSVVFSHPFVVLHGLKNNVVVLFQLSRPNATSPWTVTAIYDELKCRDTTALKQLMSGYVASPATSSVALKLPSISALCAALTSKVQKIRKDATLRYGKTYNNSRGR